MTKPAKDVVSDPISADLKKVIAWLADAGLRRASGAALGTQTPTAAPVYDRRPAGPPRPLNPATAGRPCTLARLADHRVGSPATRLTTIQPPLLPHERTTRAQEPGSTR